MTPYDDRDMEENPNGNEYEYLETPSYDEYVDAVNQWRRKSEDRNTYR
jgi:hypothetical protein